MRELPLGGWTLGRRGDPRRSGCSSTVIVPLSGIALRAFVTNWGDGVHLAEVLTLDNFRAVFDAADARARHLEHDADRHRRRRASRSPATPPIGFATHRSNDGWSRFVDYLVLVPRAVPGLLAGLAFLWVFLFFPPLAPLRSTIFSMWLAYTVVWLAYGMRLISTSLLQVGARARGGGAQRRRDARPGRRDVTLPLIRYGLLAIVAARVHDLRARVLDRRLPARARHRGDRRAARLAVGRAARSTSSPRSRCINVVLVGIGLAIALRFGVQAA